MEDIIVDIIPRAANEFSSSNPTIKSFPNSLLVNYLNNDHKTASSYRKQREVPEGKVPALYLELDGITGTFMLLIDRDYDDGCHYQAVRFRNSDTRNVSGGERVGVGWYARHVLASTIT